jgi:tRNA (guanine37-N1)-methyltransferase
VDDVPYGGGGGMVLRPEPIFEAVAWIRDRFPAARERVVLLSPQGRPLGHDSARRLSAYDRLILLCGRYEGVDERVVTDLADEEIGVGEAVLTGGEIPAMALIDAVCRFVPGVLGRGESAESDSFEGDRLDHPHFTRPPRYRGLAVPEVLRSGDHGAIARWRADRALEATRDKRPDLLRNGGKTARKAREARGEAEPWM